jgi:glyoxylase I family protein
MFRRIHHVSIICSNYERSKTFYTRTLGLDIIKETYRQERQSYKLDLALEGTYVLELFSFPNPPERVSQPEACGLRHLAFQVDDLYHTIAQLEEKNIIAEPVRKDEMTGKYFTFISDPDDLPIELYEG